ncbi:MAG TPA: hypothetical protein PK280_13175 [Planctomycetota bacterium]|nr:hypothetical protein [Planctomycetota bacterium]
MPDESKPPTGLRVERTAAGGFRFDLPRPPRAVRGAVVSTLFLAALTGILGYFARDWAQGMSVGFLCAAAAYGAFLAFALYCVVGGCFGRNALEVGPGELVICRTLPLAAEKSRVIPLREVTAVKVDTVISSGGEELWPHLVVKTAAKEHLFGMGLGRPALEWIGARVAALADLASGAAGAVTLQGSFEASVLAGRQPEDQPPPELLAELAARGLSAGDSEKFGIQVVEQTPRALRLRLAARGGRSMMLFGAVWTLGVGLMTVVSVLSLLGLISGDRPPWFLPFVFAGFLAIGIALFLAGLRARTLVEDLEVRPGEFRRQARSILGRRDESISGPGLRVSRRESHKENDRPVYHLRVTAPDGHRVKFAGNVEPDGQLWLMARIAAVLEPEAAAGREGGHD